MDKAEAEKIIAKIEDDIAVEKKDVEQAVDILAPKKDEYRDRNRGYITSSKMKCFRDCPNAYFKIYVEESFVPESTPAMEMGTLIHEVCAFGRNSFEERFEILGKWRGKKSYTGNKTPLSYTDGKIITGVLDEIDRQPLFNMNGEYEKEKTLFCSFNGVALKGTLDRIKNGMIRDFKFVSSLKDFEFQTIEFEYYLQATFYYLLAKLNGYGDCRFIWDIVSKERDKYISKSYELHQEQLLRGIADIKNTLSLMGSCVGKPKKYLELARKNGRCEGDCPAYSVCENAIQTEFSSI